MVTQDTAHERAMAAVAGALDLVRYFGRWGRRPAQHVLGNAGRFTYLLIDLARGLTAWRIYLPRMFTQATHIGYGSLFIVLLVAGFAGAVTSLQTGYQFTGTLPLYYAGAVTSIPCSIGYNTKQGAEGVGRATTTAVVSASVTILLLDALTTKLLLGVK